MIKAKICFAVAAAVIVLDQLTKHLISANLPLYEKLPVLPFLNIVHLQNSGAAFGMMNALDGGLRLLFFSAVLIAAVVVIVYFLTTADEGDRLLIVSLSMVLGGAVGNSIDRFRFGYVTDFLDLHWFGHPGLHWAAFNLADTAITVGVVLVLFHSFLAGRHKRDVHGNN